MRTEIQTDLEKGLENFLTDGIRNKLVAERGDLASAELRDAHYLFTEMVKPLVGAVIIGGKVIGDGVDEPLMPVLFVEQGGKNFALIISSDDEMNDGGRIMIERGLHAFQHPTLLDGVR